MTNHTPSAIEEQCVFKLSMCDDSIYIKHLYHAKIIKHVICNFGISFTPSVGVK